MCQEVHPNQLDQGEDLEKGISNCMLRKARLGDVAVQVIKKKLGGCSSLNNCLLINEKVGGSFKDIIPRKAYKLSVHIILGRHNCMEAQ